MFSPIRVRLASLALASLLTAPLASAFAINDPNSEGAAKSLERPVRWEITSSLDGLDYSIHDSICTDIRFVDGSTCDDVKKVIREAFDMWAVGHAYLRFRDMSASHPLLTRRGETGVREIGVVSMAATERNGLDWSRMMEGEKLGIAHLTSVRRANGRVTLDEATITINDKFCFYLDFAKIEWEAQKTCYSPEGRVAGAHNFQAVMAHEIGHAIGLEHPDLEAGTNFDNDDIRDNAVVIDCMDPAAGLRPSANVAFYSVMNRSGDYPMERKLSHDDLAGRNFLYPACESAPVEFDASPRHAYTALVAIADEQGLETGAMSVASWNPVSAVRIALDRCVAKNAPDRCRYAGGARSWIYAAARTEAAPTGRGASARKMVMVFATGWNEVEATEAIAPQCESENVALFCLPIGAFAPLDAPPPWLTLPEDEVTPSDTSP